MYEPLVEGGLEVVTLLAYAVGTVALSLAGLAAEYNSLQQYLDGEALPGAWYAYVGLVALAFAVTLARKKLRPVVAARR